MALEISKAPLQHLQSLFKEGGCGLVSSSLESTVSDTQEQSMIPLISNSMSGDGVCDGSLVRYRGMIQDQFDPEFYLKQFTVINTHTGEKDIMCGMYHDSVDIQPGFEIDFECSDNITDDRQTLYVVPIPGESQWTRTESVVGVSQGYYMSDSTVCCAKRLLEDSEGEEMDTGEDEVVMTVKKMKKGGSGDNTSSSNNTGPISLNNPLPGETRPPCLIKVYNGNEQSFPLNTIFEFIGILSSDPTLANFESSQTLSADDPVPGSFTSESSLERRVHYPPPSLVPRLHCIKATPLHHCHPSLPISLTPPLSSQVLVQNSCNVSITRQNLLDLFTTMLLGDRLAAEFLLLHLLSYVFGRTEMLAVGKLSLNISRCPRLSATPLPLLVYKLLDQLVTKSHFLPLSLSNLNSLNFVPKKDYEANKLQTGTLQLSPGTHLVIDETAMQPGQLDQRGVANIAAVGRLVQSQLVKYDFKYHQQDFECDVPVMVFSEGKSLLKVDCCIPLNITTSDPLAMPMFPDPLKSLAEFTSSAVSEMRKYLVLCKLLKYDLDDSIRQTLQDDFVQRRRVDPTMTGDTFHYLLNLSRLITISHGEEKLTLTHWERAKEMYSQQRQRIGDNQ